MPANLVVSPMQDVMQNTYLVRYRAVAAFLAAALSSGVIGFRPRLDLG